MGKRKMGNWWWRKPPLRARGSFQCLVGNCVGEDIVVDLVEAVAGCAELIHATAPSLANRGYVFGLRVSDTGKYPVIPASWHHHTPGRLHEPCFAFATDRDHPPAAGAVKIAGRIAQGPRARREPAALRCHP